MFNGNVALSSCVEPYPIVIIDTSSYQVSTTIQLKEHINHESSLYMLDQRSFIYAYDGTFLQISIEDGSILFQSKGGKFRGRYGIIPIEDGKYFAMETFNRITIVKPCYA